MLLIATREFQITFLLVLRGSVFPAFPTFLVLYTFEPLFGNVVLLVPLHSFVVYPHLLSLQLSAAHLYASEICKSPLRFRLTFFPSVSRPLKPLRIK